MRIPMCLNRIVKLVTHTSLTTRKLACLAPPKSLGTELYCTWHNRTISAHLYARGYAYAMSLGRGLIEDPTIAAINPGSVISSAIPLDRFPLPVVGIQHGRLPKMYERGLEGSPQLDLLYPDARLEKKRLEIPRIGIAVIQGRQDSVVLARGGKRFIAKANDATKGQLVYDKLVLPIEEAEHGEIGNEEWLLKEEIRLFCGFVESCGISDEDRLPEDAGWALQLQVQAS